MAKNVTVLQVFVSSPSDLGEERKALEQVIADFNATWSEDRNVQLELIKWETHMELYVRRMLLDLPAITSEYGSAMDKFGRMAMMSGTDFHEPLADIQDLLNTLQTSRTTMATTKNFVRELRDAMAQTPRMTTPYNHARRRAVAITNDFLSFIDSADRQTAEVEHVVAEIVQRRTQHTGAG